MQYRSDELKAFLHTLRGAIVGRAHAESDALQMFGKCMRALQTEQASALSEPAQLPVCALLRGAVENVAICVPEEEPGQPMPLHPGLLEHAQALHDLSPLLTWWHRPDSAKWGEPFASAHANATVIGKGGLEERDDVWVGISLVAPDIQYPEHNHPPEEVYLVLSRGHWQKSGGAWFEPGIGGLVHNPPNIMHAMRSGSSPLLATWCLWKGDG